MPGAVLTPALIAYIKVAAVKKLVVGFRDGLASLLQGMLLATLFFLAKTVCALNRVCAGSAMFTLKKLESSKQASALIHKHGIME